MNDKIIQFLKGIMICKGIKYSFVSQRAGIEYQRLMQIFNQNAIISGSELICLCKALEVEQSKLMELFDSAA